MKAGQAQAKSSCVYVKPQNIMQHMHGIIPQLFGCGAYPVVHLLLLSSLITVSTLVNWAQHLLNAADALKLISGPNGDTKIGIPVCNVIIGVRVRIVGGCRRRFVAPFESEILQTILINVNQKKFSIYYIFPLLTKLIHLEGLVQAKECFVFRIH